jgi:hypothetical protein
MERIGGVGLLGVPTFDFFVWALDTYTRGELLVELHEHLPRFLLNPAFSFLCMCAGLGLLYLSTKRHLQRILATPAKLVGVDEYRKNEMPGWLLPLLWVFVSAAVITPLLALAYSLAYKGNPPEPPHLVARKICKTVDCYPPTPQPKVQHIVNQYGPSLVSNQGSISGGVKINNSGISGTPPKQRVSLFGNGGQMGSVEMDNVHLEFYFSWELFLDDLEGSSGDRAKIKKVVDDMVTQMNSEASGLICRGQIEEVAKAAMAHAANEAPLVLSLRRNRPSCFVP